MEIPGYIPETVNCHACGAAIPLAGQTGFAHVPCPQCQAVAVVPVRFGQYLLLSPLGIGGMSTVYKAMDLPLRRYCAVKLVRAEAPANQEFIDRFAREARAAAAVNHGNIAQVYSFGQHQGQYYLAMELLAQGSLDDRIHTAGTLDEPAALAIGKQIATGLRAALQRGLLHLDIKPANILFNTDGDPKLVDFGLAHLQDSAKPSLQRPAHFPSPVATPTAGQSVWGTPNYVAPEKLRGQPEDFRSDIYSLGATLFHALTGQPPPDAATAVKSLRPTVHAATIQLLERMLAPNPSDRHGTYDELIGNFDTALAALHTPADKNTSRRTLIITGAAVLAVVAVAIVVLSPPPARKLPAPPVVKPVLPAPPPVVPSPVVVSEVAVPEIAPKSEGPPAPVAAPPEPAPPPAVEVPPPAEPARAQEEVEKQRRAEEERNQQQAAADLPLLQQLDQNLTGAWQRYDFSAARTQCAAVRPKLQGEPARKQLAVREALIGLLAEFKTQLTTDFAVQPYTVPTLTGPLARATETEVFYRTPYGEISGAWADLPPVTLAKAGDYYAATRGKAESKEALARRYLLLAVFSRHYGLTRPAAAYAELLEKLAPELKEQLAATVPQ